jgi:hypothetical protein
MGQHLALAAVLPVVGQQGANREAGYRAGRGADCGSSARTRSTSVSGV